MNSTICAFTLQNCVLLRKSYWYMMEFSIDAFLIYEFVEYYLEFCSSFGGSIAVSFLFSSPSFGGAYTYVLLWPPLKNVCNQLHIFDFWFEHYALNKLITWRSLSSLFLSLSLLSGLLSNPPILFANIFEATRESSNTRRIVRAMLTRQLLKNVKWVRVHAYLNGWFLNWCRNFIKRVWSYIR